MAEASADVSRLAEALRESAHRSETTTYQVLIQSSSYILSEMESRVPVRSGNLRESLGIRVGTNRVEIGPDMIKAPYAGYVEHGTEPHVIRPKTPNGVLRFQANGVTVYAKKVNHPGSAPHPYVMPAFQAWVDSLGPMAAEANIQTFQEAAT